MKKEVGFLSSLRLSFIVFPLIFMVFLFQLNNVFADDTQNLTPQEAQIRNTLSTAIQAATKGPAQIALLDEGTLALPEGYFFIPQKEGADFMRAIGNQSGSTFVGLIISKEVGQNWFITVDFTKSGYLREDDVKNSKEWTADNLFKSLKKGTEEGNKQRVKDGFPPLNIVGWVEQPKYDVLTHQLIWSMLVNDNEQKDASLINYNTYFLGRDGYFELELVTSNLTIADDKKYALKILESLHYNDGKQYQDFVEKTDRVAEYGIAALITGVVAKKVGLLALAGAFFIKMWKLAILIPIILLGKIEAIFEKISSKFRK